MNVKIGCGQITWKGTPAQELLAQIAQTGYDGAPASPRSGQSNEAVLAEFAEAGLEPAPGYLGADYWNPAFEADIIQRAHELASFAKQAGLTELYVAAGGFHTYTTARGLTRAQVAGHVAPQDAMSADEYTQFATVLNQVGQITLQQGVRSCFHNHVGSVIETRQEIDHLYELVDHDLIFMGPDTGHLIWGGVDPVQFFRDYRDVILTAHIKDMDPTVLKKGVAAEWDYATFSDAGVFTELGQGMVDFSTLLSELDESDFSGWLIVETDVTQRPTAVPECTNQPRLPQESGHLDEQAKDRTMYRVGIIGCGRPRGQEGATGFGMSHAHAIGYDRSADATIVALADISRDNALAFQADFGGEAIYDDYHTMLHEEELDIVSIATWPHLHAEMVIAAAEAGVQAIHCEKPMAPSYGESKRMLEACERHDVQLTINHQRRFGEPYRKAREMLRRGEIGDLQRIETTCSNMFDWGSHWFDMMFFYNDETPAEWVLAQVDRRDGPTIFGVPLEGQGISYIQFANGVQGLMRTGLGAGPLSHRLMGTEGVIELGAADDATLRIRGRGDAEWRTIPTTEGLHSEEYVPRGVLDLIDALKHGREPELSGQRALRATELIFATYESSRRRGRVKLPLDIEDSPLQSMFDGAV